MTLPPRGRERLNSWKGIAEYLQRDLATVRRWEKNLDMPVRRVAGAGRSVFAYSEEIDDWLDTAKPALPVVVAPLAIAATRSAPSDAWRGFTLTAVMLAVTAGAFARIRRG